MNKETLPSRNEAFGFFNEVGNNFLVDQDKAFATAQRIIMDLHCASAEDACNFLDSRSGRHFCNALTHYSNNFYDAIDAYRGQPTDRTKRDYKWVEKDINDYAQPKMRKVFDHDLGARA